MRKSLLVVWGLFVGSMCANAAAQYMTVEQKNGEKFSFLLDDKPVITYSNGDLVVNGSAATSYAISEVKNYHFTETPWTGASKVEANRISISNLDETTLLLQNAPASEKVMLANANGIALYTTTTATDGTVKIALPSQKGVYVLVIGTKSFKVIRN